MSGKKNRRNKVNKEPNANDVGPIKDKTKKKSIDLEIYFHQTYSLTHIAVLKSGLRQIHC